MKFLPNHVYHIYNQGNNQQQLFYTEDDYRLFLELFSSYVVPYADVLAWCLIPNHYTFHAISSGKLYSDKAGKYYA